MPMANGYDGKQELRELNSENTDEVVGRKTDLVSVSCGK